MRLNRSLYAALILVTTFLMGVAFPIGKIGLSYTTPFLLMGLRFIIAGVVMAVWTLRRPQPRSLKMWLQAAVIGAFQSAAVMGCAYFSMRWITSGEVAILTFMNPLLVVIIATLFSKARYGGRQWAGVAVGFAGVALTFGLHLQLQPGTFIGFLSAVFFAAATLLFKRWGPQFDVWVLTAYQMLFGGIILLALSAIAEQPHFTFNGTLLWVLLWLAFLSSIVQFSVWYFLLQRGDPGRTSAFLFLAPLFGVLSGWLLLGEPLHWYVGAGGGLIAFGIILVNWQQQPKLSSAGMQQEAS